MTRFAPVPLSYEEIANEERLGILTIVFNHVNENQLYLPFSMFEDEGLAKEDRLHYENDEIGSKR